MKLTFEAIFQKTKMNCNLETTGDDLTSLAVVITGRSSKLVLEKLRPVEAIPE